MSKHPKCKKCQIVFDPHCYCQKKTIIPIIQQPTKDTKMRKFWKIWVKALGEKSGKTDKESDRIAIIRTIIVLIYITTNIVIVAGVIRHWN
jgi:hypothetical protein